MTQYAKAIMAAGTSIIGLFVAYGIVSEPQAQELTVIVTAIVNLIAVYVVPNRT